MEDGIGVVAVEAELEEVSAGQGALGGPEFEFEVAGGGEHEYLCTAGQVSCGGAIAERIDYALGMAEEEKARTSSAARAYRSSTWRLEFCSSLVYTELLVRVTPNCRVK